MPILSIVQENEGIISVPAGIPGEHSRKKITIADIVRLSVFSDYSTVYLKDSQKIMVCGSLDQWLEYLPKNFLRVSRNDVINLERVKHATPNHIFMQTDLCVTFSKCRKSRYLNNTQRILKEKPYNGSNA